MNKIPKELKKAFNGLLVVLFGITAVSVIGFVFNQYENIFPRCAKYVEGQFFYICASTGTYVKCHRTNAYHIENTCVHYGDKIQCGSFTIEKVETPNCENWLPWFNRRQS